MTGTAPPLAGVGVALGVGVGVEVGVGVGVALGVGVDDGPGDGVMTGVGASKGDGCRVTLGIGVLTCGALIDGEPSSVPNDPIHPGAIARMQSSPNNLNFRDLGFTPVVAICQ